MDKKGSAAVMGNLKEIKAYLKEKGMSEEDIEAMPFESGKE